MFYLEVSAEIFAMEYERDNCTEKDKKIDRKQPLVAVNIPPMRASAIAAMNRNRNLLLEDHYFK